MVVLVFWISGISASWRQAGEKTVNDAFEVGDQPFDLVGQPHVFKTRWSATLLLAWQVGEVLGGDGGQRGSSGAMGCGGVGFPAAWSGGMRVSDQISNSVSSGPSGRIRYDEALLYVGRRK